MHRVAVAPKRAITLNLSANVLDMASDLGIDVSATVDGLLTEEVKRCYWQRWREDNKEAVEHYNTRIATEGLPLARYRAFMKGR